MRRQIRRWMMAAAGLGLMFGAAGRAVADVQISVDENGNGIGTIGRGVLAPDPGPGGLPSVLTYTLPFAGTQGDVLVNNPTEGVLDVIRFNGNGTLLFYSDNVGGADSLADTPSPPGIFYANQVTVTEVGPEGNNGFTYTPLAGQPGFTPGGVTYTVVSDGTLTTVPEPSTLLVAGVGALGFIGYALRRRSKMGS